jgi:DNA polymerase I-like protein with 3'-5' exonuclease and polymerase domains
MINTIEAFERLVEYSQKVPSDYFFLDVETDSKFERKAKVYGIAICWNDSRAFYIPIRSKPEGKGMVGKPIWPKTQQDRIVAFLEGICNSKKWVNHNAIYDILVMKYDQGVDLLPGLYSDTILLKHTTNEEKPHDLKSCAVNELGDWANQAQQDMKQSVLDNGGEWNQENKDMYLADTHILGKYAMWDVLLTCKLFKIYSARLEEQELVDFFYKEEVMPLYKEVTIPMKDAGFVIDIDHFTKQKEEIAEELRAMEKRIYSSVLPMVQPFIQQLLDDAAPIKNSGPIAIMLAEAAGVTLPQAKKKDKDTGEVTFTITLGKPAVQKQKILTPEYSDFYDWLLTGDIEYL